MASGFGCTTCDDSDCAFCVPWLLSKPSSMKLFCVWVLPLTMNQPGPRVSSVIVLGVAPGTSRASSVYRRPASGSSVATLPRITWPSEPSSVCSVGDTAVTTTASVTRAGSIVTRTNFRSLTSTVTS